jgi:hypothetical protein
MRKYLLAALLLLSAETTASAVHAEETGFLCMTEEAMNGIARKIVLNADAADEVAKSFIQTGVCMSLPRELHIEIAYRGKVFGRSNFVVEVVGFMVGSYDHMFYGLMAKAGGSV